MVCVSMLITLLMICVLLIYYLLKRNKQHWKKLNVVGPKPHLLFGNYKEYILRQITIFEVHQQIYNAYPNEKVVGLYRFTTPILLLRDLDVIQYVFIRGFDNFVNRGIKFGEKYDNNLVASSDDTWRLLRTRLSPIFTSGKLKHMLYLIERCADNMMKHLNTVIASQHECDIQDIVKRYSVASISACAFGIDKDVATTDEALNRVGSMMFTQYFSLEFLYLCPSLVRKLGFSSGLPDEVINYFTSLVDAIKKQRNGVPSGRRDFMDLLLEMKNVAEAKAEQKCEGDVGKFNPITDDVIALQAAAFYGGGFESSSTSISFMLYELAKNQDIQDKIVEEVMHVLNENNGELTMDALKQLTYTGQAMDETLRMYGVTDLLRRVSTPSCTIPGTDITLKRDDYVYVPVRGIHYDEKYYPEPYKFDPDRFSPVNVKSRHPCAYLGFGLGPRHCIGMRFAKLQSRIFLAKFLTQYRVEPADSPKTFKYDPMKLTLMSIDGVPLKIVRRN